MDTQEISQFLKEKNIKPSYARIQIFNYLNKATNHPSVDEIYNELVQEIPTLSKTTVYNTLNIFEEEGIVWSITVDNIEKRYELATDDHIHFKCESCGEIYDIPYENVDLLPDEFKGFQIREQNILLKGICKNCNN